MPTPYTHTKELSMRTFFKQSTKSRTSYKYFIKTKIFKSIYSESAVFSNSCTLSLQILKGENPYVYFRDKKTNLERLTCQSSIVSSDKNNHKNY